MCNYKIVTKHDEDLNEVYLIAKKIERVSVIGNKIELYDDWVYITMPDGARNLVFKSKEKAIKYIALQIVCN